ncbi:hypothetical protein AVEN_76149-1 [Araneus ventricosus]|uniref:Uncharacterized protein n=1 Tax=Araneus ventricosus TaxID=182803 RepID=A0A4Y2E7W8_ARAVE|nr:hypothetical protein AVEN_76149-1 [Araneus ventricosus]
MKCFNSNHHVRIAGRLVLKPLIPKRVHLTLTSLVLSEKRWISKVSIPFFYKETLRSRVLLVPPPPFLPPHFLPTPLLTPHFRYPPFLPSYFFESETEPPVPICECRHSDAQLMIQSLPGREIIPEWQKIWFYDSVFEHLLPVKNKIYLYSTKHQGSN